MTQYRSARLSQLAGFAGAAVFLQASAGMASAETAAQTVRMSPHLAVYELSLLRGNGSSAPVAVSGRIVYEFNGSACKGYEVSFRQITEITPSEGEPRMTDTRSTTFESGDGKTLNFRIENMIGDRVVSTNQGEATRSGDGALSINIKEPMPKRSDADVDVTFPTAQMLHSIIAARAGETAMEMKIYDGSDGGDKVYHTLNIFGHRSQEPLTDPTKDVAAMKGMARWRTNVSYFDNAKADANPSYKMAFQMWDNGISSDLVLDYGDFALKGTMSKLEMLPESPCP
ncbi:MULTISPECIES: cell envelope integrity EipB family protein [unclassified Beijerinckia]|uniref:cell envelope integrity EipB family protein n=1 Tax=unclassified Beijerinckia TaxID=2638183 RepID=UPI000894E936|nr:MULTISPECIES: cell envelope integrity EipB family protein [unclassified Beijerinckia]MDH7794515.1 hypothetical protein [Beijerinckia sp. GAS462]SEB64959.1 protein of unknown function [Beijerinckia sp. 28-YEA-48]